MPPKSKAKMSKSPVGHSEDTPRSVSAGLSHFSGEKKYSLSEKKMSNMITTVTEEDYGPQFPFLVLSQAQCEELLKLKVEEIESELALFLKLKPTIELTDAAILDYYVGAAYWAKQQGYNTKQFAGFFSISHQLLNKIKDEECSMVDLFKTYHQKLAGIGFEEKICDLDFFSIEQAKNITDYLHRSIFQHYKLYQFLFSKPQQEEIMFSHLSIEVPLPANTPFPPPLDEALLESVYRDFVLLHSASSEGVDVASSSHSSLQPDVPLPENMEDLFAKLSPEDVKTIIQEVSQEVIHNLQANLENKIKTQETAVLSKINKIKTVPVEEIHAAGNV